MQKHQTEALDNFDQIPIGGNTGFAVAEFESDQADPAAVQDFSKMTFGQRIRSKGIKIKLDGLEELRAKLEQNPHAQLFEPDDSPIEIHQILKESNPACLQKALQCFELWMQASRSWGSKQIKELIENGYINGKANAKKIATDLMFQCFDSRPEDCENTLIEGLKSKLPKTIGGYLAAINELLAEFGIKKLKYLKPYISDVVRVMNNEKLPIVKNEGMSLLKAGYKWLGKDFFASQISSLKDNIKKQLDAFWETNNTQEVMTANRGNTKQTKAKEPTENIASGKATRSVSTNKRESPKQQQASSNGLDIYEISDPVDALKAFDEKWCDSVLAAQKWSIKTKMLQEITTKCAVIKISPTEHRHITQMTKRLLNDSNFNVVLCSLKLIAALAKGLRKNFAHASKILFPLILPKLRDKKTQMIEETMNVLKEFYVVFSLEEVAQDIKAGLKDKAAGMRNSLAQWLDANLERRLQDGTAGDRLIDFLKSSSFVSAIENLLNDPNPEVRASTVKLAGKIMCLAGENTFKDLDKTLNNKNLANKVSDILDTSAIFEPSKSQSKSVSKQNRSRNNSLSNKKSLLREDSNLLQSNFYSCGSDEDLVDLTQQLGKQMKNLNDGGNWQKRKESAEAIMRNLQNLSSKGKKFYASNIHDYLTIVKARIADPNKQLIKIFVSLIGVTFSQMQEKEARSQAKVFLHALAEGLADKNEANRREIYATFNKIAEAAGNDSLLTCLGQVLCQENTVSSIKQYVLEYILQSEAFVSKVEEGKLDGKQMKDFPKATVVCLCDKNKDLRVLAQRLFKTIADKTGVEPFRGQVKDQKQAFRNDLNSFMDKYEGIGNHNESSMLSHGSHSSTSNLHQRKVSPVSKTNGNPPTASTHKRQASKSNAKKNNSLNSSRSHFKPPTNLNEQEPNSLTFTIKINEGESFAPLNILTEYRLERQQEGVRHRHCHQHPISEEDKIHRQIQQLFSPELTSRMYSNDYKKCLEASTRFIKFCKDVSMHSQMREVADLMVKWVSIRLYGGSPLFSGLMELFPALFSVLLKKKVMFTDTEIDISFHALRDYVLATHYSENANLELLKTNASLLVELSSGDRVVRRILIQFMGNCQGSNFEAFTIHRHALKSASDYYRKILALLSCHLIEYFSNGALLEEAAKVAQLREDQQFVRLLSDKFHGGMLKQFGFVRAFQSVNSVQEQSKAISQSKNVNKSVSKSKAHDSIHHSRGNSTQGVPSNKTISVVTPGNKKKGSLNCSAIMDEGDAVSEKNYFKPQVNMSPMDGKSHKLHPRLMGSQHLNSSAHFNNNGSSTQQNVSPQLGGSSTHYGSSSYNRSPETGNNNRYELETSKYPMPNHHNPLGANLKKLSTTPFHEPSLLFFGTLLQSQNQNSDKIANQLQIHRNIIYACIFNSFIDAMKPSVREKRSPEQISQYTALAQQLIKCQNIFKGLAKQLISGSIRFTVDQLVYEDENRTSIQSRLKARGFTDFKGDLFIKGVNGVMLRILDNAPPLFVLNTFFRLLVAVVLGVSESSIGELPIGNKNKKIGLLMRCINRVTNAHFTKSSDNKNQHDKDGTVGQFLLLAKEYLDIMGVMDLQHFQQQYQSTLSQTAQAKAPNNTEDSIIMCICTVFRCLNEQGCLAQAVISLKSTNVAMGEERLIGQYLSKELGIDMHLGENYQTLKVSEEVRAEQPKEDDLELRRIVELLSRNKTFQEGIDLLGSYIEGSANRGVKFDFRQYFSRLSFQPAFIEKVAEQLNESHMPISSSNSNKTMNPDIQGKLQRLKMKLQGINPSQKSKTPNRKAIQQNQTPKRDTDSGYSRQHDLKKRIEDMKNKVSLSTNKLR